MNKLKEMRVQNGFTQKKMAQLLSLSITGYQNYELGTREPSLDMLCKIADILGCTVDYLLGRETAVGAPNETTIATNYIKQLGLENDKQFKNVAQLYALLPETQRTYVLGFLMGYLQNMGISIKKIID